MSFGPHDYIRHILDEADYLLHTSQGLSAEEFLANETLQRAFVRSLEIIGEATKQLPDSFRAAHPQVDWRPMARMRDRLIAHPRDRLPGRPPAHTRFRRVRPRRADPACRGAARDRRGRRARAG